MTGAASQRLTLTERMAYGTGGVVLFLSVWSSLVAVGCSPPSISTFTL